MSDEGARVLVVDDNEMNRDMLSRRLLRLNYEVLKWEKKWHPEIEEPEVAFPHYAKTMAEYLSAAGVVAS